MVAPNRIFISYGHDEYAAVAERLKNDLRDRGYDVWFDLDRLKPGGDWETYIEEGLQWVSEAPGTGRFVMLMTPHSVRRPNGYCLNELARALERRLSIIPVMVVWSEPPLSICRIQWLDMRDCVPPQERPERYAAKFARLLEALEWERLDLQGTQPRLLQHLQPLPFDGDIQQHLARFTGRQWIFDELKAWLAEPQAKKIFWITGKPGVGKTALASWLCTHWREVAAFHLCRQGDMRKSDPRRCILSIAYQLSSQIPDYQTRLNALNLEEIVNELNAETLFDALLVEPLSGNFPEPNHTVVILIDALDEATRGSRNELASVLSSAFARTPPWLRLIITSRPEPEVTYALQGLTPYELDSSTLENEKDIRTYLSRELKRYAEDDKVPPSTIDTIVDRSEGIFLYVEYIRQELALRRLSLERPEQFPSGLGGVYAQFFQRQFSDIDSYRNTIRPVLEVICAAQEPPAVRMLALIFQWNDYQQIDFVRSIGSLFRIKEGRLTPFHGSVIDWLILPDRGGQYFISTSEGHRRLAIYGWQEYQSGVATISPYMLAHLATHLCESRRWDDLRNLLTDFDFILAKCSNGMIHELILGYDEALAQDSLPSGLRVAIDEFSHFIRTNSHLLGTQPELLYQQAANQPNQTLPATQAVQLLQPSIEPRPWIRWLNKPLEKSACEMTFVGHRGGVNSCACSPDGSQFVSAGDDHLIVWNIASGKILLRLTGHTEPITTCSFSPDGTYIISTSYDGTMRLWSARTGEELGIPVNPNGGVSACAFSPDGTQVVYAVGPYYDYLLERWDKSPNLMVRDLTTGTDVVEFDHRGSVRDCVFSPDGKRVMAAYFDEKIVIWDVETRNALVTINWKYYHVTTCAFSPDGKFILAGSEGGTYSGGVKLFDSATGAEVKTLISGWSAVNECAFSPDGTLVVAGSNDHTLKLWEVSTGREVATLAEHSASIYGCCFTPDGLHLLSASRDMTLKLWDAGGQVESPTRPRHIECVNTCTFSPDGMRIVTGSGAMPFSGPQTDMCDGEIKIWDGQTGAEMATLLSENTVWVEDCAFSADGEHIISCFCTAYSGYIQLTEVKTGNKLNEIKPPAFNFTISPDGTRVLADVRDGLKLLDVRTGEEIANLPIHNERVNVCALSPDGLKVVCGLEGSALKVWDVAGGVEILNLSGHEGPVNACAFSPDGLMIASASSDRILKLWDAVTGVELAALSSNENTAQDWRTASLGACAFSPDGTLIAASFRENIIRFWNIATRVEVGQYWSASYIRAIAWSPDGKRLAAGDADGYLHLVQLENFPRAGK